LYSNMKIYNSIFSSS